VLASERTLNLCQVDSVPCASGKCEINDVCRLKSNLLVVVGGQELLALLKQLALEQ